MWIAFLLAALARFSTIESHSAVDLSRDPFVLQTCWKLVVDAHYGFSHGELAAFVVRNASGGIDIVNWSTTGEPDSARWIGPFPSGTIAIIHTHPNWMPAPSRVDIRTAAQTRVPVYVLTRSRISKTNGSTVEIVSDGDWRPRT